MALKDYWQSYKFLIYYRYKQIGTLLLVQLAPPCDCQSRFTKNYHKSAKKVLYHFKNN